MPERNIKGTMEVINSLPMHFRCALHYTVTHGQNESYYNLRKDGRSHLRLSENTPVHAAECEHF